MIVNEKTVFVIDGGAGRAAASIPALLKYQKNNPQEDFKICVYGWDTLFWGIPELQDKVFNIDNKGIFDNIFLSATRVISPEPYRVPSYYKQQKSLAEAFDVLINNTDVHTDLPNLKFVLSKGEEINALNAFAQAIQQDETRKDKLNIVIQPWGSTAKKVGKYTVDESSRSLTNETYLKIVKVLSEKYNLYYFGDKTLCPEEDNYALKYEGDLRFWLSMIDAADYFIGCDSVGQHFARGLDKPGTIILGSTFAQNISYPDFFNIYEKEGPKKYAPLRINNIDSHLADRINDTRMDLSDSEVDALIKNIEAHIKKSLKVK
jgi:ADP-heptose:LPS heptosyltransferase